MIDAFAWRLRSAFIWFRYTRLGVLLRERHVDVVVDDHDEARFRGEVEDAIERGVCEAGSLAGDLGRDELLVDAELADAGEHAGERLQNPANVIDAVHVRWVEPGDHRIEARLLLLRERAILAGDVSVGERVVVERRVAVQVVGRREVAGVPVRPLLLQRDPEERRPADARARDLQELADVDPFLDVVREVEVGVEELVGGTLTLCVERTRAAEEERQHRQCEEHTERNRRTERRPASHARLPRCLSGAIGERISWADSTPGATDAPTEVRG
jgi:hypothetical protein